jgi:hypothetical protein
MKTSRELVAIALERVKADLKAEGIAWGPRELLVLEVAIIAGVRVAREEFNDELGERLRRREMKERGNR